MKVYELLMMCCTIVTVLSAPRSKSKNPPTTYDQKQTGDYNIQLHLKDFQIIALLADDTLSGLGDYDYSYDYADFTVKPTSQKPSTSTVTATTTTTQKALTSTTLKTSSVPSVSITTYSPTKPSMSTSKPFTSSLNPQALLSNTNLTVDNPKEEITTKASKPNSVRIVIEDEKKTESPITSISIVPPEDMGTFADHISLGEIVHYRKCATGYARDKRGRCRKIRRPQMPFDVSQLATNFASKFRQSNQHFVPN